MYHYKLNEDLMTLQNLDFDYNTNVFLIDKFQDFGIKLFYGQLIDQWHFYFQDNFSLMVL